MRIRVVLIDPQRLVREGLALMAQGTPDIQIVGEASDAREGYAAIEKVNPDVALMELALPGVDGLHATREILRRGPAVRVLILTMLDAEANVSRAVGAGALGYALKSQSGEDVLEAIRVVARGTMYFAPGLKPRRSTAPPRRLSNEVPAPIGPLSPREREVFALVIRGFSTGAIARELSISAKTVETHRYHINAKLGIHSSAELVRFAAMHELLPPFPKRVDPTRD